MLFGSLLPVAVQAQSDATPPLPDRNSMRPGAPVPVKPLLPGELPTVPWTEADVKAAKDSCSELLASTTLDYQPLDPIKDGICGAPAPILVRSIGSEPKVVIDPPATISCPMAKELGDWLRDAVQPAAKALLGAAVVTLRNATSYACRNRYGGANTPLSEHALANALDVSEFVLASGDRITVLDAWPKLIITAAPVPLPNPTREHGPTPSATSAATPQPTAQKTAGLTPAKSSSVTRAKAAPEPPPSPPPVASAPISDPKSLFVKQVHDAACKDFGTVLGPEANEAHKNHFHLDMKERRKSFCE